MESKRNKIQDEKPKEIYTQFQKRPSRYKAAVVHLVKIPGNVL